MTLHDHRGRFDRRMEPFITWCARQGITPNQLTIVSLVLTAGAAVCFYFSNPASYWLLPVGGVLLMVGAMLDSADGLLARYTDTASPRGDYLDHTFDRFADVLLLVGLSFSTWVPLWIGMLAIVGTLLTSYMGTQAQAVGVGRDYGGLLGRADRMTILFIAPFAQAALEVIGYTLPMGTNLLEVSLVIIAVAGNITAIQRFYVSYRALEEEDRKPK